MKVHKSLWTQVRIFGQKPRINVDEIFRDPHLSIHYWYACSLGGLNRVDGIYDVTSSGTKRYLLIHMPAWHTSIKQNKNL